MSNRMRTLALAAGLLLGASQTAGAACPADGATPMNIGPLSPVTTFPLWVQDSTGLTLEICPGTDQVNCISVPPIDGDPLSQQIGFGDEGFWASADTSIVTSAGLDALLVSAVEAAFLPDFADGNQFPFTRLRIRIDIPVAGDYRVIHPWGQIDYLGVSAGVRAINDSFDIQFFPDQIGYQGRIGPILAWDTFDRATATLPDAAGGPLVGYIGTLNFVNPLTGGSEHAVAGSPCGTNFFRVESLDGVAIDPDDIDGDGSVTGVSNPLFVVTGKVFTGVAPTPLVVDRTNYARTTDGQVQVFATSAPTAGVSVSGGPNLGGPHALTGDGTGLFFASVPVADAGTLPESVTVSATSIDNGPTDINSALVDQVDIASATYNAGTGELRVDATSSDESVAAPPVLTLAPFGDFAGAELVGGTISVGGVVAPPARVTVDSSAGGQDSRAVKVVGANVAPIAVDDLGIVTDEDTPVTIVVLLNDSDPDAPTNTIDPTTVTIVTAPSGGLATVDPVSGEVTYAPNLNFNGPDSFTYRVRDQVGALSNTATVGITVNPVEDAPTAANNVGNVAVNGTVNIRVLNNDTDPEENIDPATVTVVEQGSLGTATAQPDGTVDYQAGAISGVDRFTYTVADATGLVSNTATVRVNIQGDLITITRAVFRTSLGRWVIDGTNTVVGPGNEVTVVLERTGGLIATVPVDVAGNWSIRTPANLTTLPQDGDRVLATSTAGGTARRIVSLRP